ncbi:C4-dicarboxylate TRAP transporter substrate-binding protein [Desulfobacula sp.]|uniref:C4-dicarboxylate TRAP transporter substrate-binding protein n=1 Tax=Desulfobacula sp. TaxID=2593537 RepID=UPI0027154BF9|nr:C4-dicarboxylate TRAP transporter substrate-binding protein [Desulfobacula sp.]
MKQKTTFFIARMFFRNLFFVSIAVITINLAAIPASAVEYIQAATWTPPTHIISENLYTFWAERVKHYSQGNLEVKVDLGSAMLTPRGAMAALADGIVDVAAHTGQYTPSELNVSAAVEELAMLYTDTFTMIAAIADFDFNDPMMREQWQRNGVVYGGPYITPPYLLLCNKEVSTLDQFKGKKTRLPGRAAGAWGSEAGAVPVSLSSNEMYSALDKGALDCTTACLPDMLDRKLYEVAKHITEMPITIFWAGYGWAYNPKFWRGLTVDQRRVLFNAQADAIAHFIFKAFIEGERDAMVSLKTEGVTFHKPNPALLKSLNNFKNKQEERAADIAKKKFRIDDPQALHTRFKETVIKWTKRLKDVPRDDEAAYAEILRKEIFDKVDLSKYGLN